MNRKQLYEEKRNKKHRHNKMMLLTLFLICLVVFLIFHFHNNQKNTFINKYPIHGVLIDQNNGYLDFNALAKTNQKMIYIRSTQGASYSDDNFDNNYQRGLGSGLPIGIYHIFGFSSKVNKQFENIKRTVNNDTGDLPIMIKIQYYNSYSRHNINLEKQKSRIKKLINQLHGYYNKKIILSTDYKSWKQLNFKIKYLDFSNNSKTEGNSVGKFIESDTPVKIKVSNQDEVFDGIGFSGDRKKWIKYLQKLRNED
ncbi:hypothetical protein GSH19_01280 [Lactobacillus sp. S2-2]|uniref:GH25 family lysozyme n=1 Tax=Lactobacillus sp. S2-2 TaxID=2692917 RepID=UPI001F1A3719|nr:GH25 family lysozyme [Lactobacillus sp. S2-2]MCF6514814.1 hypothetical protein [Lactobacillus sp. S2-2]